MLPTDRHCRLTIRLLTSLSVSLAVALGAHGAIDAFAAESGGHAHDLYAHVAVAPLLGVASGLASAALLWSALRRLGALRRNDPMLEFAKQLDFASMIPACIAVTAASLAILLAMEFVEQYIASGCILGVGDALGGNVIFGIAMVASIACTATFLGLRFASAVVNTAAATIVLAVSWFLGVDRFRTLRALVLDDAPERSLVRVSLLTQPLGLRAPPASSR